MESNWRPYSIFSSQSQLLSRKYSLQKDGCCGVDTSISVVFGELVYQTVLLSFGLVQILVISQLFLRAACICWQSLESCSAKSRMFLRLDMMRCLKYFVNLKDHLTKKLPMLRKLVRSPVHMSCLITINMFFQNQREEQGDQIDSQQEENVLIVTRDEHHKSQKLEVYEYQVSGKTPKYIDNIHGHIFKLFSQTEHDFYEFVRDIKEDDQRAGLKVFLPEYLGVSTQLQLEKMEYVQKQKTVEAGQTHRNLWIDHIASRNEAVRSKQKYICLRNLTFNFENPNILDLKLGIKKNKKSNAKFQKSTTNSHGFRINGMVVQLHNGEEFEQCFMSKYFGQKIVLEQIENYLALFFFDGKRINCCLLQTFLKQLEELTHIFKKFRGIKFISSSLFLSYDASDPKKSCLRLIDFDRYEHDQLVEEDTNISRGLENIAVFLKNIQKAVGPHEELLSAKSLGIFGKDVVIVPEHKMAEYKFKKAEEENAI